MEVIEITSKKIKEVLEKLKSKKSPSTDGMHPLFLDETAKEMSYPLQIFFRTVQATVQ